MKKNTMSVSPFGSHPHMEAIAVMPVRSDRKAGAELPAWIFVEKGSYPPFLKFSAVYPLALPSVKRQLLRMNAAVFH